MEEIDVTEIIRLRRDSALLDLLQEVMKQGIQHLSITLCQDGGLAIYGNNYGTKAHGYDKNRDIREAIASIKIEHGIGD